MKEVWVLFGIYYEEDFYECKEIISIHRHSYSAHEQKKFLEKYSKKYETYEIKCFEILDEKQQP